MIRQIITKNNIIYLLLISSITLYTLYLSAPFFEYLSLEPAIRLSHTPFALFLFCFAAILNFIKDDKANKLLQPSSRTKIFLFVIMILFMLSIGIIKKNLVIHIYGDLEGAVLLFCGILIGSRHKNWEYLDKIYIIILIYAIILNLISFRSLQSIDRVYTEYSLTNNLQVLLYPVLFYIFLYPKRSKKVHAYVILSAFLIFFIEQVLFQKRVMFFRVIVVIFFLYYIQNLYLNRSFLGYFSIVIKKSLIIAIPLVLIALLIKNYFDLNVFDSLPQFRARVVGKKGTFQTILDDGRYQIAGAALDNLISNEDYIVGKGFGGIIIDPRFWWTIPIGNYDVKGATSQVEIGQTWPIWKGGILFWLLINLIFISAISSFKKIKRSYFSLVCWAFVLIHYLFLLAETHWTAPSQLLIILLGSACGHLLSIERGKDNNLGRRIVYNKVH